MPLFLLALPMLGVLFFTSYLVLLHQGHLCPLYQRALSAKPSKMNTDETATTLAEERFMACMRRLVLPQLLLAGLTLTNFHVQIINRIATGYPAWYIVMALAIVASQNPDKDVTGKKTNNRVSFWCNAKTQQYLVRTMVMYAVIQGGLFASFMPPA